MTLVTKKIEAIQIARALAVLLVVLFHSHYLVDNFPPGFRVELPFLYSRGHLGVNIFFVVSGFIIADVTSRDGFTLAPYFIKRFFRIYPIYWLFCYAALVSYYKFGLNIGQKLEYETIYASFLAAPISDGFPIYPVGWTLTYEVLFYLIAGLVLSFAGHRVIILILLIFSLVGLATQGLARPDLGHFEVWLHVLLSPFQILFAAGILIFCYQDKVVKLGVIPALTLSVAAFYITVAFPPEIVGIIGPCLGASLLIISLLNAEKAGILARQKNNLFQIIIRALVSIGNASFSLYLVHWIVFRWMGYEKTLAYLSLPAWSAELWRYVGVLIAVAISFALYHFLERPVIKVGNSISNLITRPVKKRAVVFEPS